MRDSQEKSEKNNPNLQENNPDQEQQIEQPQPQKPQQPLVIKPYNSQTTEETERQIKSNTIQPNRPQLRMQIIKRRRDYAQPYKFNESDADKNIQFKAVSDPLNHKQKLIIDIGQSFIIRLQGSNLYVSSGAQTKWSRRINKAIQILPESNYMEIQDDNTELLKFLETTYPLMEEALQSNQTIDIFQNDFNVLDNDNEDVENTQISNVIKETKSLFYLNCKGKRVCCIDFLPWIGKQPFHIVAQSFIQNLNFDDRVTFSMKSSKSSILFWNFQDLHQIDPILILNSPLQILCFQINPTDPNIVVGGAINGQIYMWDLKGFNFQGKGKMKKDGKKKSIRNLCLSEEISEINYSLSSALQDPSNIPSTPEGVRKNVSSHKNPVLSLKWIPSSIEIDKKFLYNTNPNTSQFTNQFVSISHDGQLLFWDKRFYDNEKKQYQGLVWKAMFGMQLFRPQGGALMGGSLVTFKKKENKGFITITSDQGQLLQIDWTNRPSQQVPKPDPIVAYWSNQKSMRPPTGLSPSPFHKDIILTVHDYHFTVWKEKTQVPIFQSMIIKHAYITCGTWSLSRPGVILIGRSDGILDIWDFLDQSHKCTLQYQVGAIGISSMKIHPIMHNTVAVGDNEGNLHILELPFSFSKKIGDQQRTMQEFWDRQVERVKYFESRFEIRQNQMNKEKGRRQMQQKTQGQKQNKQKENEEQQFQKQYQQYCSKFLKDFVQDK